MKSSEKGVFPNDLTVTDEFLPAILEEASRESSVRRRVFPNIGLTGDYPRYISVQGSTAILIPEPSWDKMLPVLNLKEDPEEERPSPLCQYLYPNLLAGNHVLLLTNKNEVSKSVFLIYIYHILAKEPFERSRLYYNGGPRAIIIVPTDDRVIKLHEHLMLYKARVSENEEKGFEGNVGRVAAMVGESPTIGKFDDIVIATPKGIGDFFDRNPKKLKPFTYYLKFLVVDRAEECSIAAKKLISFLEKVTKKNHLQLLVLAHVLRPGNWIDKLTTLMLDSKRVIIRSEDPWEVEVSGNPQEAVQEEHLGDDQQAIQETQ